MDLFTGKNKLAYLINVGDLLGIPIDFVDVELYQVRLSEITTKTLAAWKSNIISDQKLKIIGELPIIRNIKNLGESVVGLVYTPYSSYLNNTNVMLGAATGMKNFVQAVGTETLNLTETLIGGFSKMIGERICGFHGLILELFGTNQYLTFFSTLS